MCHVFRCVSPRTRLWVGRFSKPEGTQCSESLFGWRKQVECPQLVTQWISQMFSLIDRFPPGNRNSKLIKSLLGNKMEYTKVSNQNQYNLFRSIGPRYILSVKNQYIVKLFINKMCLIICMIFFYNFNLTFKNYKQILMCYCTYRTFMCYCNISWITKPQA